MILKKIITLSIIFFIFFLIIFFMTRGITYYDEGYILYAADRVSRGEVIYRDFDFAYTPLSVYITALGFKIFGVRVLSERLVMMIFNIGSILLIYLITKKITRSRILSFLTILMFLFWGIGHINFTWPIMLAIFSGLLNCWFLVRGFNKSLKKDFFFAGIFIVITFFLKQNFGIALLLSNFISFILIKEIRNKNIYFYIQGILISSFIFTLWLLVTNSLAQFIDNFFTYTIRRVVLEGVLNTPFLYFDKRYLYSFMKNIFYLVPLIAAFLAIKLSKRKGFLVVYIFCASYYLFGIRPTTDYVHLVPLLGISGIPLASLIHNFKRKNLKILLYLFLLVLILLGGYSSLYKNYYRWELSLISQNYFFSDKKISIWIEKDKGEKMLELSSYIQKNTKENDYIYVHVYAPLIYFISQRKNPTKYAVHPSNKSTKYERDVVLELNKKHVELVVTTGDYMYDKSNIMKFISSKYIKTITIDGYVIWKKSARII